MLAHLHKATSCPTARAYSLRPARNSWWVFLPGSKRWVGFVPGWTFWGGQKTHQPGRARAGAGTGHPRCPFGVGGPTIAATREELPEAKHANRLPLTSARHAKGHHATPGGIFGLETACLLVSGGGAAGPGPWVAKQLPCLGISGSVPFSSTERRAGKKQVSAVPQRGTVPH